MYYVPDGTKMCGFYECKKCDQRYLSLQIRPKMICEYCGKLPEMEIGPDDPMPTVDEDAVLLEVIEGAEAVERMDILLSHTVTGGDDDEWI